MAGTALLGRLTWRVATVTAVVDENESARIGALRGSLAALALVAALALFFSRLLPVVAVGAEPAPARGS